MDISTKTAVKTVTQTTHSTTVSAEEISALAMVAVKNKIGFDGEGDVTARAVRNADGSVSVDVTIETEVNAADAVGGSTAAPAPVGALPQIPMGIGAPVPTA